MHVEILIKCLFTSTELLKIIYKYYRITHEQVKISKLIYKFKEINKIAYEQVRISKLIYKFKEINRIIYKQVRVSELNIDLMKLTELLISK